MEKDGISELPPQQALGGRRPFAGAGKYLTAIALLMADHIRIICTVFNLDLREKDYQPLPGSAVSPEIHLSRDLSFLKNIALLTG